MTKVTACWLNRVVDRDGTNVHIKFDDLEDAIVFVDSALAEDLHPRAAQMRCVEQALRDGTERGERAWAAFSDAAELAIKGGC